MFSAHSVPTTNLDLLAYEQLLSLSISELRQQCELAGLDDQSVDTKDELIAGIAARRAWPRLAEYFARFYLSLGK